MKIDTAVVLAGGQGDRLKPLTNGIPKAMVEINNKPLLQWVIEWLKLNGVTNIVIGVAHLKEKIIDYFGNGEKFGVNIIYSVHTVEGGTAEGFRLAISRYVQNQMFFALNGDQITDLKLKEFAHYHTRNKSIATIAAGSLRCPYGQLEIDSDNNISGFLEKPLCSHMSCNTGIYVFNRQILDYLPTTGDIEKTAFLTLAKNQLLKAYMHKGLFITVNTLKDLIEARQLLGATNR